MAYSDTRGGIIDSRWATVRAVLLDLDGTLVETDNRWATVLAAKLQPLRRIFPRLDCDSVGRRVVMGIETPANYAISLVEHLGLGGSFFGLADRVRRSKGLATRGAAQLVEGTIPLLQALKSRYALAVVTTRARPEAYAFLTQAGLNGYFQAVITRQDVLRLKPHPEPVRKAAALLGVKPEQCVMVGDTTMDVHSARRAGALAVGVLSGFGERAELERAGSDLILERADALLRYLTEPSELPASREPSAGRIEGAFRA
ncbi:MAG: HAD family hydrolase [Anaerolineae bacterium]